jgi:hypothetical protein
MRATNIPFLLPVAAWLGALQALPDRATLTSDPVRLAGLASVLGTLTVLIYRLGVWRQEMENTKHNIGAEVKGYREETAANFDRLERRLEAIDHLITVSSEHRIQSVRWQSRTEKRLERLEEFHNEETPR